LLKAKVQDDAELPPMLGYSCKRYTHVQLLDHFAAEPFSDAVAAQITAANNAVQQAQQSVGTAAVSHLAKQQQQQRRLLEEQLSPQQQVAVGSGGTGAAQQQPSGSTPMAPVQQEQQQPQQLMAEAAPDQLQLQPPTGFVAEPVWQLPPQVLQPGVVFAGDPLLMQQPLLLLPEQQPEIVMLDANSWQQQQQQQQQPSIQQQPHAAAGQPKQAKLARTAPGRRHEQLLLKLGTKQQHEDHGHGPAEGSDDYQREQPPSHEEAKQPYGQQEQQPPSGQEQQPQQQAGQEQQQQPPQYQQQPQPYDPQQPQPHDPQQYGQPLLQVPVGMPYVQQPYIVQQPVYYQQPLYQELPVQQLPYGQVPPQPYYYYTEPGSGYPPPVPPAEQGQPGDMPQQQQQDRGGREAEWREEALRQQRQRSEWESRAREAEEEEELERRQQAPPSLDPVAAGELGIERDRSLPEGTFKQTYWVCDAAWPSNRDEQVRPRRQLQLADWPPVAAGLNVVCAWPLPLQEASGNVLVYLGGATPLGAAQPPMIFENARRHNALVVMVEHRYFGDSLPFKVSPSAKLPTQYYHWLTMPQVGLVD
jgi:hypothetical protein